jgi:hypothetical protein
MQSAVKCFSPVPVVSPNARISLPVVGCVMLKLGHVTGIAIPPFDTLDNGLPTYKVALMLASAR